MNDTDLYRLGFVIVAVLLVTSVLLGLRLEKAYRAYAERTGATDLPPYSLRSWVRNFQFFCAAATVRPAPDMDGGLKMLLLAYKVVTWTGVATLPLLAVFALIRFMPR